MRIILAWFHTEMALHDDGRTRHKHEMLAARYKSKATRAAQPDVDTRSARPCPSYKRPLLRRNAFNLSS